MTPDVNVLVAASRRDHVHHAKAHQWLTQALSAGANQSGPVSTFRLMGTVVASYLRLVTHPKIFVNPTPVCPALAFIDALLACPGVGWLTGEAEWPTMRQLCTEQTLAGNDIPDAWIAATTLSHGDILVTFDRDFLRLLPAQHLQLLPVS